MRRQDPPQRVQNAAEQMRNTSPYGSFRGYVPQQTGTQQPVYHAVPPQQGPSGNRFSQANGQRGFTAAGGIQSKPPKKKKGIWKIFITVVALAAIAGGAVAGVQISRDLAEQKAISDKVTPYDGLYCPGVYVDGIHLGGMTPEQAMNSVQSQISKRNADWQVELTYNGEVAAVINTEMLNMGVDQNHLAELLNEAWKPGHTGTQAERCQQMEELETTPYTSYSAKPSGDTGELNRLLEQLKDSIDLPAQDAALLAFDPTQAYPFVFSEEVVGRNLDINPVLDQLYQMVSTMTSGTVELVPEEIQPQVYLADLEKHYSLRSSAVTPIDRHSTEDRNNNIRRCFELISGTVLAPGKTFSFNGVVGERSLNNGFYPAIEYINDEHVEGVGGGACQASTTLYQAAVCAGLQIVSRRPHSDSVSYAEYGTDATVYWMRGGKQIDMSFKNNTDSNIYIVASVVSNSSGNVAKVNIYGDDLGSVTYKIETETVEILPSIMDPVYVSDKESAAKAKDGCIVNSYRAQYTEGILTGREFLFTDTYKPKPEKIYSPSSAGE